MPRDLGGRYAECDRRIEDARPVDVHRHILFRGHRAQPRHVIERKHGAPDAVVRGLDADERGRKPEAAEFLAQALADLYGQRWQIETNLRHLKQSMKMDVLHCETVAGVLKELTMFALVYNLVRTVTCVAAQRQQVPVDRISFADAYG